MKATKNERKLYYILSGEGAEGVWSVVYTTLLGLKQRLTKECCHGARWAVAYVYVYDNMHGHVGSAVFGYTHKMIPNDVFLLGRKVLLKNKKK